VPGRPHSAAVAAVLEAIDERTAPQTDFLMAALVRGAWPGGIADRLDAAAVQWVRRWRPGAGTPDYVGSLLGGGATSN
jgi:hypothetical protein